MARPEQRSEQRTTQRPPLTFRTGHNRFDIDETRRPAGMTYKWGRKTMMGQDDVENQINMESNAWTPVPAERHPELTGLRAKAGAEIVRGGLVLMERAEEITEESRQLESFDAHHQVAQQVQRLGLEGHRAAGRGIKTSYDRPDEVPG